MEKKTVIELEFQSENYDSTVTLTRKGQSEVVVFELGKRSVPARNSRPDGDLHFHFKGSRVRLAELANFIAEILVSSKEEFLP